MTYLEAIFIFYFNMATFTHLNDALAEMPDNADIIVLPPDADHLSDNEEIDEENLDTAYMPNDVAGLVSYLFYCNYVYSQYIHKQFFTGGN